jgi:hypothetical protein
VEGEVVAYDAAAGELRPFQEVTFRRRKQGIAAAARAVPVGLFCFELLYADGEDFTELPYLDRRARLAEAVTLSDRLRLSLRLPAWRLPSSQRLGFACLDPRHGWARRTGAARLRAVSVPRRTPSRCRAGCSTLPGLANDELRLLDRRLGHSTWRRKRRWRPPSSRRWPMGPRV